MKKNIFILFLFIFTADLSARTDSISLCMQGISIHPGNQEDFATDYDRKLDSHGNFIFTPGFLISYDRAVSNEWFTHVRFTGSYISDCAMLPAGYIGAGVIYPVIGGKNYSMNAFLGGGLFCRKDWTYRFKDHYSPVMQKARSVEWIITPFPGIDVSFHPWDFRGSLVISLSTVIYVSQLCAGVQIKI